MQSLDSIATHYPYIFSGLASTVVYFLFQKFFAKKSLQSSIMSSLIFGLCEAPEKTWSGRFGRPSPM